MEFEVEDYFDNIQNLRMLDPTSAYFGNPPGPAYSIFFEEEWLGAVGFVFPYKGVAGVWMMTTFAVEEHPKEFIKACHEIFNGVVENFELWRVESRIPTGNKKFVTFIEKFGFKNEGLARKFGPNQEDFYIYAWVKD